MIIVVADTQYFELEDRRPGNKSKMAGPPFMVVEIDSRKYSEFANER